MTYITFFWEKLKSVQKMTNGRNRNPNGACNICKSLEKKTKPTGSVLTYGTQKYNQVSYFVQERAFKKQV